ncbi:MAG: caspase family protein [Thermodesulfobacteriota bacterium]
MRAPPASNPPARDGIAQRLALVLVLLLILGLGVAADRHAQVLAPQKQPLPSSSVEGPVGDLYAVIIGVSKYKNPKVPELAVSDKDARDFAAFLKGQSSLFRTLHVNLLCNEEATKTAVEKELYYGLRRAGKDDTVVVFLSGHGADDPGSPGEFFFLTYDADPEFLAATAVHMNRQWFLSRLDSRRVVLIADACHAGGFSVRGAKSLSNSLERFMRQFRESEGRILITSSRADEVSQEDPDLGNSLFTYHLLNGLKGAADKDKDGIVTLRELYDYVYENTKKQTRGYQSPQMEGKLVGAFPLALTVSTDPTTPISKPLQPEPSVASLPRERPLSISAQKRIKEGEYLVNGTNPDGTPYSGKAVIGREGVSYRMTWQISGETHYGKGTRSGDKLYVNWGKSPDSLGGLVTYSITEGGVLEGTWYGGRGKETLVPK